MARKKHSGLGKGLDSLIPDFYDEDFDSNNPVSLEDMLGDDKPVDEIVEDNSTEEVEEIDEEPVEEKIEEESIQEEIVDNPVEEVEEVIEEQIVVEEQNELSERDLANIQEVKDIVAKNPRITLWSAQSAAVFRYLRKTEPEFSISKEASLMIEEAVSKKYPEIWKLFDED